MKCINRRGSVERKTRAWVQRTGRAEVVQHLVGADLRIHSLDDSSHCEGSGREYDVREQAKQNKAIAGEQVGGR